MALEVTKMPNYPLYQFLVNKRVWHDASQAYARQVSDGEFNLRKTYPDLASVITKNHEKTDLGYLFDWSKTDQGHQYWAELHYEFLAKKSKEPIPTFNSEASAWI